MLVGYMRVSTDGDRQVLDLQRDALLPPCAKSSMSPTTCWFICPRWAGST